MTVRWSLPKWFQRKRSNIVVCTMLSAFALFVGEKKGLGKNGTFFGERE